jgi:pyruvate dehydrogenase E1 component alpha subunit
MKKKAAPKYNVFPSDAKKAIAELGKDRLISALEQMLLIRNFEIRAESAYQHGKIGGFFHAYTGQEAIQVACIAAFGVKHWFTTTYRCHALALLLGVTPKEAMAELYGKETGIARGRGGSMHLYADRMLGGLAIVGGHLPIATGAAFSIKYQNQNDLASLCFLGEGAVVQGAVHESLNLASLWDLPCIYIIENNQWGMGTHVSRALSIQPIAESLAPCYNIKGYTFDGMDFFGCYQGFQHVHQEIMKDRRPVLIEILTERFKGHSVSDPGLYRTKESLAEVMKKDSILTFKDALIKAKMLTEEQYKAMDEKQKELVIEAMKYADDSPLPDPIILEEGVLAP